MIKRLKKRFNVWLFKVFEKQISKCVLLQPPMVDHKVYKPIIIKKECSVSEDELYVNPEVLNYVVESIKLEILKLVSVHITIDSETSPIYCGTRKIIGTIIIQKELI